MSKSKKAVIKQYKVTHEHNGDEFYVYGRNKDAALTIGGYE